MRCGERLVQVDVHNVEAHIARTAFAEKCVEICSVVIHQAASLMNEFRNLQDTRLEDAQRIGIGHHHGCHLTSHFTEKLAKMLDIDCSVSKALHLHDFKSADCCRGRVSAVSRVGNQNLCASDILSVFVISTDDHQTGQLAMSPSTGIQGEFLQTGKLGKRFLQVVIDF